MKNLNEEKNESLLQNQPLSFPYQDTLNGEKKQELKKHICNNINEKKAYENIGNNGLIMSKNFPDYFEEGTSQKGKINASKVKGKLYFNENSFLEMENGLNYKGYQYMKNESEEDSCKINDIPEQFLTESKKLNLCSFNNQHYLNKFLVIGDVKVGKTSLITHLISYAQHYTKISDSQYYGYFDSYGNVSFQELNISNDNTLKSFEYSAIVLVVYSTNDRKTFSKACRFIEYHKGEMLEKNCKIILIANDGNNGA